MKKQSQWGEKASEVYVDINGTMSPQTRAFWFPTQDYFYYASVSQTLVFKLSTSDSLKERQVPAPTPDLQNQNV